MERKTRQIVDESATYVVDEAVKERFRINQRNVGAYMSDSWKMEKKVTSMIAKKQIKEKDAASMVNKANSIQEEIAGKKLGSVLRTVVRRSAFQAGADQSLRFSLDMNLHIINEDVDKEGKWARNLDSPLKLTEVRTLPYAVLEIKTQKEAPAWVNELKNSGYIIPSANFSKFLYGTCKLFPNDVQFKPLWWDRVIELEQIAPASPPLITCALLGKTPSSVKFRANMEDIMEQRALEEEQRQKIKSLRASVKDLERQESEVKLKVPPTLPPRKHEPKVIDQSVGGADPTVVQIEIPPNVRFSQHHSAPYCLQLLTTITGRRQI